MDFAIHHKRVTASTNADARAGSHGDVFTADEQTAGRGRLDHRWHSRPGENLTFSVVLSVDGMPPDAAATLPLVVGASVRRVAGGDIKWPNDVLVNGRKIAGILCERHGDLVVCGIGLNVNQTVFPDELSGRATSLKAESGRDFQLDDVLCRVLSSLDELYAEWRRGGFAAVHPEIALHDALKGRRISVFQTDSDPVPVEGICGGIRADGTLDVGGKPVYAGEAHVVAR